MWVCLKQSWSRVESYWPSDSKSTWVNLSQCQYIFFSKKHTAQWQVNSAIQLWFPGTGPLAHKKFSLNPNHLELPSSKSNKWAQCHYPSNLRQTIHQPEETDSRGSDLVATNSVIHALGTDHTPTTPTQSHCTLGSGKTPHMSTKLPAKSQTWKGKQLCEDILRFNNIFHKINQDLRLHVMEEICDNGAPWATNKVDLNS